MARPSGLPLSPTLNHDSGEDNIYLKGKGRETHLTSTYSFIRKYWMRFSPAKVSSPAPVLCINEKKSFFCFFFWSFCNHFVMGTLHSFGLGLYDTWLSCCTIYSTTASHVYLFRLALRAGSTQLARSVLVDPPGLSF